MEFSDSKLSLQRAKRKRQGRKHWGPEAKINAVTQWLAIGNMRVVAEVTGVSHDLLRQWKLQPWWNEAVAEIRATRHLAVDNKLSKIVDRSLELIEDRLEKGDVALDAKGKIYRTPVKLRDATKVATDLMTKQIEIAKLDTTENVQQQQQSVQDQIRMLAEEFAKFNKARTIDVVAKEIPNAIYEERETRLQEGSSSVYEQAGSSQKENPTECSPQGNGESGISTQGGWEGRGPQDSTEQGWSTDETLEPESSTSESEPFIFTQQ